MLLAYIFYITIQVCGRENIDNYKKEMVRIGLFYFCWSFRFSNIKKPNKNISKYYPQN